LILLYYFLVGNVECSIRFPVVQGKEYLRVLQQQPLTTPDYLTMMNVQNALYYIQISIGSNSQDFYLAVDTGSSWLWITDSSGVDVTWAEDHFSCSDSETCQMTKLRETFDYEEESQGEGFVCLDVVNFSNGYVVHNQDFILADQISGFEDFSGDGIIGFGLDYPNFLDHLKDQGIITHRNFSLYLSYTQYENTTNDTNSELIIGGYDEKYMLNKESQFIYFPLVSNDTWLVDSWTIGLIGFNFGNITVSNASINSVFIDSGTSAIWIAGSQWDQLAQAIINLTTTCRVDNSLLNFTTTVSCNCTNYSQLVSALPDIVFVVGNSASCGSFFISSEPVHEQR